MHIIFVTLPRYLVPVSTFLRKLGHKIYYLKTSGIESVRVEELHQEGISPLPFEDLPLFTGFSGTDSDPEQTSMIRTREIAPVEFLTCLDSCFPHTTHCQQKLQIAVHSVVSDQVTGSTGKVNIWAKSHPECSHILIDVRLSAFADPVLAPNVRLLIVPLEIFDTFIKNVIRLFFGFLPHRKIPGPRKTSDECKKENSSRDVLADRVVYVTHQGLSYGNLFQKDLFYSPDEDSELHPEHLLHFDYSNVEKPPGNLRWVSIGNHHRSAIQNICSALFIVMKGIPHIRRLRHIIGLLIVCRVYVVYQSFVKKLEDYPDLSVALIDYEILCPKELLLALESRGIKSVAVQERFILSFYNLYGSTILTNYLCASPYAAERMKKSPLYAVENYIPLGQYRSDILENSKKNSPPEILKLPKAQGLKIITVLGYHTQLTWQGSQSDLLINWKAHRQFLGDMIRLSEDIPGVFIVLRYKITDWVSLPVFSDLVEKINAAGNITISQDYDKNYTSYHLCAHSDLVVAKHTSLGDECLAVGIPVLFHEYTHNTKRLISDAFDYHPAKIMCYSYEELLGGAKIILRDKSNEMTPDFEYLRKGVYGGLGDGVVKERVHHYIRNMLEEITVTGKKRV